MIIEHAWLHVRPGEVEQFEAHLREARPIIEGAPGCDGAEVRRQIEDGQRHLLVVRWESVEAHEAFRASEAYQRWRALTHPHYDETPSVTHFGEPLDL